MKDSNRNIKFSFLYQDSGNYKQFGFEIFTNLKEISILEIEKTIKEKLTDCEFFDAKKWNLNDLHSFEFDKHFDHNWHEFEEVEFTVESITSDIDIEQFLLNIK
jgi:hypothetical protein